MVTTEKYACDVVTSHENPLRVVDRHSGRVIVYDNIEPFGEQLIFFGYFEDDGQEVEKTLDFDSRLRVESDS